VKPNIEKLKEKETPMKQLHVHYKKNHCGKVGGTKNEVYKLCYLKQDMPVRLSNYQ